MHFGAASRFLIVALLVAGCADESVPGPGLETFTPVSDDPSDVPVKGITEAQRARFRDGDARFDAVFRYADGLGPLYIRASCGSCHEGAARGPGAVQKMAVVESDGLTPAVDQSALPFGHTVRPYTIAGADTPIEPPDGVTSIKV